LPLNHPGNEQLAQTLIKLSAAPIQESSQKTYFYNLQRFVRFAEEVGLAPQQALPPGQGAVVSLHLMEYFVAWAKDKYSPSSIRGTFSALQAWHANKRTQIPPMQLDRISRLMQASNIQLGSKAQPKSKPGLPLEVLQILLQEVDGLLGHTPASGILLRDQAWFVISFFGFLRHSESRALQLQDVTLITALNQPPHFQLCIRRSKTDPTSKGTTIVLANVGHGDIQIYDRVMRYKAYLLYLGLPPTHPFFVDFSGCTAHPSRPNHVGPRAFPTRLQYYLSLALARQPYLGFISTTFSSHSFRRGGTSLAWSCGGPRDLLILHGRWTSSAIDLYLCPDYTQRLSVTARTTRSPF